MKQYKSYVEFIREAIVNTEPHSLCDYLLTLSAFSHPGEQTTALMSSNLNAGQVNDIVRYLDEEYCSFLNFDIFNMIAEKYGIDEGREEMRYPDRLNIFTSRHSIDDFIKVRDYNRNEISKG